MAKKEKPDSAATQSVDAAEKSQNLTPGSHIYMATVPNAAFSLRRHTSRHAPSYIYMIQREVSLTHTHAEHSVTKACRHGNLKAALVHSENKFKIKGLPLVCPTGPMVGSRSVPWRLRRPGALRYGIKPVTDLRPAREPDERQFWHQCKSPRLFRRLRKRAPPPTVSERHLPSGTNGVRVRDTSPDESDLPFEWKNSREHQYTQYTSIIRSHTTAAVRFDGRPGDTACAEGSAAGRYFGAVGSAQSGSRSCRHTHNSAKMKV